MPFTLLTAGPQAAEAQRAEASRLQAATEQLQQELAAAREKLRSSEELAERRGAELRSKSAAASSLDLLSK